MSSTANTDDITTSDEYRAYRRVGMAPAFWAGRKASLTAVISALGNRTFAELNANANRVVRAVRRLGVEPGDAVSIMSTNRPEWVEVYAASMRAGLRLTPVNWHLTADETAYIVEDSESKVIFIDAGLPQAGEVAGGCRNGLAKVAIGGSIAECLDFDELVAAEDGTDIQVAQPGTTMLYTSGTTGRPKGVYREAPRSLRPVDASRHRETDVYLVTGPFYHGGPMAVTLHPPLMLGSPMVIMWRFDPEESLRLIEMHRVTHTHMVPTMFHRLLALPDEVKNRYDTSSLRAVWHGAAPCPVHVKREIIEWFGPVVYEYYAATEGLGCSVDSNTWLEHPGTVGRPDPADQVVVGDDDGNPLQPGEIGLLWLKAPDRFAFRYFKDEAKTAGAYRKTHFTLGDMGYKDEAGWLYLTDRSADLIISGGVNIYPAEIDAVLLQHPAVADACCVGVPNAEWGEEVKAVVQVKDGVDHSDELATELIAFVRDHLSHFKCPRTVDFVDALPRSDSGKLYRRRVREAFAR